MVKHLWPNFLTNAGEYRNSEQYWNELWTTDVDPDGLHPEWKPWLNLSYVNGAPFGDGNPIFNRLSVADRKAVRVIQTQPSGPGIVLDFWLEEIITPDDTVPSVVELVITCELSAEAAHYAGQLIRSWVTTGEITLRSEFAETAYRDSSAEEWELTSPYHLVA